MSDRNLRLQVVLNAVDKITRPLKLAQSSVKSLASVVKESKNQLKQLNDQSKLIDAFRDTSAKAAVTAQNLKKAKEEASALAIQFKQTANPTAQQAKLLQHAKDRANDLQQAYNGLRISVQKQREGLSNAGINTRKLNDAQKQLKERVTSSTSALERQEDQLKRTGEMQRKMSAIKSQYRKTLEVRDRIAGAGASSMGAGIAVGMPAFNAVKSNSAIEDSMKGVAKQVNGLLNDKGGRTTKYYEMREGIQRLSEILPMQNGAMDIASLVEGGARMGVTKDSDPWEKQKKDLLSFAAVSAKASKAFEMPADQLAEDLGKIAFLYKIPIKNIEDLGDTLNYLDDNAQSKGADIINVMQRMGDVADKMDYKQAAALGSTFLSLGAAPEVAATASKAMMRQLGIASQQSKSFKEGIKSLGLDAVKLEKGIAYNAVDTIKDVLGRIKGLSKERQLGVMTQIFGKEFGDDAQKLALNIDEFIRQLDLTQKAGAKGSMQRESDIDKDSLSSQTRLLKTGIENTSSSLGESLRIPLLEVIELAKRATGSFRQFIDENPRLATTLVKTAAAISVLLTGFGAMAIAVAAAFGPMAIMRMAFAMIGIKLPGIISMLGGLAKGIQFIGTAIMWLGRVMLANPILGVLTAIAIAAVYIWQNWETLGPKIKALWASITQWTHQTWNAITQLISTKWTEIVAGAKALPAQFVEAGRGMIDSLLSGINEKWETLKAKLASLSSYLPDWMKSNPTIPAAATAQAIPKSTAKKSGFAGLFDSGGYIPSGKFGIAGEYGPEFVNGPARITSRKQTAIMAAVASLGLSAAVPAATAPLHPFSLPAAEYKTQSAAPAAQRNAPIVSAGKTEIHIHAAPNQSPQDIARIVMQAMDERDRKQQARARRQFSDREVF
ncbi:phage tail tape measure protein [Plesiomonas sp.]|uniref:phage tail tape measure protein n=1 Tax=Plesiomonas sp. TaxID=2486279 RepID=UPI003F34C863